MGLIIASPGWAAVRFKSVDTDKTFETVPNKCYLLLPPSLSLVSFLSHSLVYDSQLSLKSLSVSQPCHVQAEFLPSKRRVPSLLV